MNKSIGERVRTRREQLGLKQRDLAKKAGIGESTLSRIETGKREPQMRSLVALAKALGVKLTKFID